MSNSEQTCLFYAILRELEDRLGGSRKLKDCTAQMRWPKRGVYFFFEQGEERSGKRGPRVVRVGTHALKMNSKSTLWGRLRQHRGHEDLTGNHRGSIFRLHVGDAIINKEELKRQYPEWGVGQSAPRFTVLTEAPMEKRVSSYIGDMPFLWLSVEDSAGPESERGYIEKNSIALLSNFDRRDSLSAVDPPSREWLGHYCSNEKVRLSGLWNDKHVKGEKVDPMFLQLLENLVSRL